jgi:hypothetical protein
MVHFPHTTHTILQNQRAEKMGIEGAHCWLYIVSIACSDKSSLTHSVSFANKQDYSAELQLNDSLSQIPPTAGLFKGFKNCILDVIRYIGSSRERCWFVLILSIMAETGATTLSKYAIEKSSSNLLLLACFMVVIR